MCRHQCPTGRCHDFMKNEQLKSGAISPEYGYNSIVLSARIVMSTSRTSTRSLTINAAFLKDIKDDNRDLKSLLDRITPLTEHWQIATNHWVELMELFAELRDQLALHFTLEEAYGYFEEAIGTAPQLSVTAELLRSDHAKLFERIRDLADSALEVSPESSEQITRFLDRYGKFMESLGQHEEAELKLILDALDDGLGVGD